MKKWIKKIFTWSNVKAFFIGFGSAYALMNAVQAMWESDMNAYMAIASSLVLFFGMLVALGASIKVGVKVEKN